MAALACPAVHMLGCAPNFPSCRASAYGCLARRMLPMAVLPSPDCTVENFAWREIGERSIDFSFWRGSCNRAPGKLKFAGFSGYVRHLFRHFPRHFFSHCFRHLFRHTMMALIQTYLHTLLGTLFRTPLGTLLGTPVQTLFPPPFQQVCATFFATSQDASANLRNRKLRRSFRCYYGRC